jgi:uncharacterized phage-associated protein
MYDARQIANWFVNRSAQDKRSLSIMSLLKLTYLAHGWHLGHRSTPLFSNKIEAWQYGPVIPDVYNAFRRQGVNVVSQVSGSVSEISDVDVSLLQEVYRVYGRLSAFKLSDLTHEPGGPWDIATQTGGHFAPIPNDLIRQHFELKLSKSQRENA